MVKVESDELALGELANTPIYIPRPLVAGGVHTMKISEYPPQKLHKLHLPNEAMPDQAAGEAPALRKTRPLLSVNPTSPKDPQLGALMIEEGLISEAQLHEALRTQS